jgi:rhodanese-related sulfurtransferase
MGIFNVLFEKKTDFKELVKRGALIIDVRTPGEYATGHVKGSKNIPLDQLDKHIDALKKDGKPVIACCRSGARSGAAVSRMKAAGIEAYNGGPWDSLDAQLG